MHAIFTNEKIKNKTEKTGFFEKITRKEDNKEKLEKLKNRIEFIRINQGLNLIFFYAK
jgi:hypothetical protein